MLRKVVVIATTSTALSWAVGPPQVARSDASSAPTGLTAYGQLIWNLDALVHDYYGGRHACMRAQRFAIHPCTSGRYNDGDYRATFASARRSSFRTVARRSNPLGSLNAISITISGRHIQCGAGRWLAITNAPAGWGEPVFCVKA
jgi:hypothetical protein